MHQFPVVDENFLCAFDEITEAMRIVGNPGQQSMKRNHREPAADRREQIRRPINGASTEARITRNTLSKTVRRASDRRALTRTIKSVNMKTIIPRSEICTKVSVCGSAPRPRSTRTGVQYSCHRFIL